MLNILHCTVTVVNPQSETQPYKWEIGMLQGVPALLRRITVMATWKDGEYDTYEWPRDGKINDIVNLLCGEEFLAKETIVRVIRVMSVVSVLNVGEMKTLQPNMAKETPGYYTLTTNVVPAEALLG